MACRLAYAREWALRCVHEAQMHSKNSFITLTYSDENLKSPKLIYRDFQTFMKRLRKTQNDPIGVFVTGEYGDKTKRPHWHAILFNYQPRDGKPARETQQGHEVFTSDSLEETWGLGRTEYGSVTLESAGYCARYSAKKLVHGLDDEHEFEPISKKSSKHAIGKKWIETYWRDVFTHGYVEHNGVLHPIPRYYVKWFKENRPDDYRRYIIETQSERTRVASEKARSEKEEFEANAHKRLDAGRFDLGVSPNERKNKVLLSRVKQLNKHHKF